MTTGQLFVRRIRFYVLAFTLACIGCTDDSRPKAEPGDLLQPDISHVDVVHDADPQVQRMRRALVGLCFQEPSLTPAIEPTATKPAHEDSATNEVQIDLWLIDLENLTFQLMTTSEAPIWTVSGSFVEKDGAYIADATITELHYQ
ncbi:hypothetical protein [Rhodopirellula europaea]|uniref:hypothetical protein n=1 Tax=Rhodopirellula europaea TaxID=1263866 RepID=UPI0011817D4D|nr:hypothetical protein [Rhodopirellula europaea]